VSKHQVTGYIELIEAVSYLKRQEFSSFDVSLCIDLLTSMDNGTFANVILGFLNSDASQKYLEYSYAHNGGFDKYIFHRFEDHSDIRLHVWWPEDARAELDYAPHNHRWDFLSKIFVGDLRENIFLPHATKEDNVITRNKHVYEIDNKTTFSKTEFVYTENLYLSSTRKHESGSVYTRRNDVLHTAFASGYDPAITLCITGPQKNEVTDVYLIDRLEASHNTRGRTKNTEEVRERLENVLHVVRNV
jgi:hypothetical protein